MCSRFVGFITILLLSILSGPENTSGGVLLPFSNTHNTELDYLVAKNGLDFVCLIHRLLFIVWKV